MGLPGLSNCPDLVSARCSHSRLRVNRCRASSCLGDRALGDRVGPDQTITGVRHAWTFDEFYTAMAIEGLDADGDGVYSKEELAPLAKVNVESLQEFGYFTFIHFDGDDKFLTLKPPVDYWVDYEDTVLTLHFTLPLETPGRVAPVRSLARPGETILRLGRPRPQGTWPARLWGKVIVFCRMSIAVEV